MALLWCVFSALATCKSVVVNTVYSGMIVFALAFDLAESPFPRAEAVCLCVPSLQPNAILQALLPPPRGSLPVFPVSRCMLVTAHEC